MSKSCRSHADASARQCSQRTSSCPSIIRQTRIVPSLYPGSRARLSPLDGLRLQRRAARDQVDRAGVPRRRASSRRRSASSPRRAATTTTSGPRSPSWAGPGSRSPRTTAARASGSSSSRPRPRRSATRCAPTPLLSKPPPRCSSRPRAPTSRSGAGCPGSPRGRARRRRPRAADAESSRRCRGRRPRLQRRRRGRPGRPAGPQVERLDLIDTTRGYSRVSAAAATHCRATSGAADRAVVALAAELTGVAQRALDMAVAYAKEREQFGRPIGAYQAVSHRCAEMLYDIEEARSLTYYAAWRRTPSRSRCRWPRRWRRRAPPTPPGG